MRSNAIKRLEDEYEMNRRDAIGKIIKDILKIVGLSGIITGAGYELISSYNSREEERKKSLKDYIEKVGTKEFIEGNSTIYSPNYFYPTTFSVAQEMYNRHPYLRKNYSPDEIHKFWVNELNFGRRFKEESKGTKILIKGERYKTLKKAN